jgi:hypothetical protein
MGSLVSFNCSSCKWESDTYVLGIGMITYRHPIPRKREELNLFECVKCGLFSSRHCDDPIETKRRFQCSKCRGKMIYFDLENLDKKPCVNCGEKKLLEIPSACWD